MDDPKTKHAGLLSRTVVKNCELETAPSSGKPARTCVAVATGNAPDANSSLADMDIRLNTGDFAANK